MYNVIFTLKKTGVYPNSSLLQLKKYFGASTYVLRHKKLINRIRNDIIPFLISTNPRWRPLCEAPPPPSENHLHSIVIMSLNFFFSEPYLEYISITNFFNRMCSSTQNPTWLPYWLALLAQVPRLSDVQLLFHMGI